MDAGGRGRYRPRGRRRGSPPRRAPPRSRCCRGRAGASAFRAGGRCRAGAGRSRARRARRARRSGPSRSARRGGCAGSRRRRACRSCAKASGSRGRRRSGNRGARGSPSGCGAAISFCLALSAAGSSVEPASGGADRELRRPRLMCSPAIFTASASGFSRAPWQTSQGLPEKIAADLLAHPGGVGLLPAPLEVRDDALEDFASSRRSAGRRHR